MSYLELSNPTTNSCDYEVYLSSPFNQDYYIQIRITSTDYGASTSNVSSYVVYKDAPSSGTSRYVRGVVDDGMSAGRRYTLYAYAQAANGTWYLAGEDSIRTLENDGETYDYGFTNVEIKTAEPYNIGDEIKITATVKNYKRSIGPSYIVELRDKNGDLLDEDSENPLDGKDTNNAYLYPVLSEDHIENGVIQYTLRIVADESGWVEADSDDNTEIIEVPISIDGNDDFSYATPLSFDEIITGTIDQDNDQDYYLLDDIPSDCEAFMVVLDYNDVPHEGDYDCDIYVYDENEDKISLTNGITAGTTYVKVPVTGNKYYIRIDLDGDFISSKDQKYRLYVTDIPVSYVEEANDISEASEIHEGMNILGNLRNSEDHYYTITPTVSRKLRFVVQTDSRDNDYSIILFDSNEDVLYRDSGSSPVMAEYDLEEGSQYFIKVSPEENTTIDNSTYLLYVEVEDVGGIFTPVIPVNINIEENETKYGNFSSNTCYQYQILFSTSGTANFYLEKTSGNFIARMELFKVGSPDIYPDQLLAGTNNMLITAEVKSGDIYRLVVTNLTGYGDYFVRCKCYSDNDFSPTILRNYIEEYTDFECDGISVKIPYYMTPPGTTEYGGKNTPYEIKEYLRSHSTPSNYQSCANSNKRYTGIDCSGFVTYVLNETTEGAILSHWNTVYANGISARSLTEPSEGTVITAAKDITPGCVIRTDNGGHILVVYKIVTDNDVVTEIHYAHSNGSHGPHKAYIIIGDETKDLSDRMQKWVDIAYTDAQAKGYYNHTLLLDCVNGKIK